MSNSSTIILNSSNIVNSNNNQLVFNIAGNGVEFKNENRVALASLSMYYSWFNITSSNNNNSFSYVWYNFAGSTTNVITIPDGSYTVSELNSYLQYKMIQNGHYLVDGSGNYVYYLEMVTNSSAYKIQLNSYPIPTALPAGYTNPAAITFPAVATTPQFIIPSTNIRDYFGINAGTYPNPVQATNYSKLSDYTPQVSRISSVVLSCNLIRNKYSNPNNILYSFIPTVSFGESIDIKPSNFIYNSISPGIYDKIVITFLDQNYSPITILDNEIVIMLTIEQ